MVDTTRDVTRVGNTTAISDKGGYHKVGPLRGHHKDCDKGGYQKTGYYEGHHKGGYRKRCHRCGYHEYQNGCD